MRGIQAQLEQTNRDLLKRSEQIQYFYHTLSHELKTPLTSAREFVSIVIDGLAGELNSTQLNYLGIAKDSCTELAVYINDLLDATRLDTGKLHIELKAVSLAAIIQRAMTIMEPAAAGKKIRLSGELDTHLTDVMVDESRIMQILTNLLNNALKFTSEGGEIIVKLGEDPKSSEYVQISVTDTGCGIPKDQIDNLFHRFYQIKRATPRRKKASAWDCIFAARWCCYMGETFGWKARSARAALFHSRCPSSRPQKPRTSSSSTMIPRCAKRCASSSRTMVLMSRRSREAAKPCNRWAEKLRTSWCWT